MGILQKLEIMGDTREANCRPASKLPFIVGACTAFLSFFLCTGRSVGLEWVAWIGEITPGISFVGYALTLPSSLFLHWWPLDLLICDLGVNLRRADIGVSHYVAQGLDGHTLGERERGECMSCDMERQAETDAATLSQRVQVFIAAIVARYVEHRIRIPVSVVV